jgi:hypothetical protein
VNKTGDKRRKAQQQVNTIRYNEREKETMEEASPRIVEVA